MLTVRVPDPASCCLSLLFDFSFLQVLLGRLTLDLLELGPAGTEEFSGKIVPVDLYTTKIPRDIVGG